MFENSVRPSVITEYVCNAMAKARYQELEDGSYYGDIFLCPGVWGTGRTIEACRDSLQIALSEWLVSVYEDRELTPEVNEMVLINPFWYRIGD